MNKCVYIVNDGYLGDFENSISKVIEFLSGKLNEVPEQYRDSATIDFDIHSYRDGDLDKSYSIYYVRPETPEEESARMAVENERYRKQEDRERAEFLRLQAKFGNTENANG